MRRTQAWEREPSQTEATESERPARRKNVLCFCTERTHQAEQNECQRQWKEGWEDGRKRLYKTCDFTYLLFMYLFILNYGPRGIFTFRKGFTRSLKERTITKDLGFQVLAILSQCWLPSQECSPLIFPKIAASTSRFLMYSQSELRKMTNVTFLIGYQSSGIEFCWPCVFF